METSKNNILKINSDLKLNEIHAGNCLELMAKLDDHSIDLIATDPPYIMNITSNGARMEYGDYSFARHFFRSFLKECKRVLKAGHHLYMFCDWRTYPVIWEASLGILTMKNLVIWDIGRPRLGSYYRFSYEMLAFFMNDITTYKFTGQKLDKIKIKDRAKRDLWRIPDIAPIKRNHPSQKPVPVMEEIILNSSRDGDIVLDPFCGSGTTLEAARKHNRNYIGFEINPDYVAIAQKRLNGND